MKKRPARLSIPDPCHENWSDMTPILDGRFCGSCKKVVVDFSKMSDREILSYFKQYKGQACGNFRPDQLDRDLRPAIIELPVGARKAAAAILVTAATAGTVSAQSQIPDISNPLQTEVVRSIHHSKPEAETHRIISGRVLDAESGEPLIAANVIIRGTRTGTMTDFDGKFQLKAPVSADDSVPIEISYVGFASTSVMISDGTGDVGDIEMNPGVVLQGIVITDSHIPFAMVGAISYGIQAEASDSTTTEEPEVTELPAVVVSPNPMVQHIQLDLFRFDKGNYTAYLFDVSGKEVWSEKRKLEAGDHTLQFDIDTPLIDGAYIVHIRSKSMQLSEMVVRQER